MKKYVITLAALSGIICLCLFAGSGFSKRTDVVLFGYTVSADGSAMMLETSVAGSMGHIRDIVTKQQDHAVYCSFYTAFGGCNSRIGARNRFEIELEDSCTEIYFDRGSEEAALVLQKDETTGRWVQR